MISLVEFGRIIEIGSDQPPRGYSPLDFLDAADVAERSPGTHNGQMGPGKTSNFTSAGNSHEFATVDLKTVVGVICWY